MSKKIKILLIEDNPADVKLFDYSLREALNTEYDLQMAKDLSEGLELLQKQRFTIIILDLSLPDSFGLETFTSIQQASSDTPIIVLTGMEDDSVGMDAVKFGAQDFLIKGKIKSKTLKRSINYSIERHKLLTELSIKTRKLEERTLELLAEKHKLSEAQKLAHIGSWELEIKTEQFMLSDEFRNIYGLTDDSRIASFDSFLSHIHNADRDLVSDTLRNSIKNLLPLSLIYRIIRPDGVIRTLHLLGEVQADNFGIAMKIAGTSQDVTERFHEEELDKLALAATKSYNSVVILNPEGKIEWVNEGFTRLSGYELDEVKNTSGEILQKGKKESIITQGSYCSRVVKEKTPVSYEVLNYDKQGIGYWTITTLTPVLNKHEEVEHIIAIDSDITIRRQMEEELMQANKIAEHSLRKGNKALTELMIAKKQLEESMKVKEQFLANMSHEIRTPMNAIIGFTNLLLKTPIDGDQHQYVNAIKTSGENLLVIINDILDFSKIQSGKVTLEQIELNFSTLLPPIVEVMKGKAAEKNIRFLTSIDERIPDQVLGDPVRLNQILLNLIGNAIKFTDHGEVKVALELVGEKADAVEVLFSVTDTGIGIESSKLSSIFEGFTQATNETTRKYGGTGLGLSIVKQLVELQGGRVHVKSAPGKGSSFIFVLEFKRCNKKLNPELESAHEDNLANPLYEGLRILLVEDNTLNQVLAKKVLTDWKWNVDIAETGVSAVQKIRDNDFDLVLMDIQLPEMDGYEATRQIRKYTAEPKTNIPIIAMTAHAINGEAEKCLRAGMNDYVSKPFDPKDLYHKVVNVLRQSTENKTILKQPYKMQPTATKNTDLGYLTELSRGSKEFILQMISLFLEQTPIALASLEEAAKNKDWAMVGRVAHKMKPSLAFMGIKNLKDLIAALEEEAKQGTNPDGMKEKILTIRDVCNKAILELEAEKSAFV